MELGLSNTLLAGDPRLVDHIVGEVKSQGIFDQFRKECIADVDTKPAYQNLHTRVEGSVNSFLSKQTWKPDLNKNQLRETLRKHIHEAPYLDAGVERIVDQVVNPKVYSVFMPQIEDVVYKFLGIERPKAKEKNGACGLKDLLPKDLDPVSPESDKNSLKDVSLESVDGIDDLDINKEEKISNEQKLHDDETYTEKDKDVSLENGQLLTDEKLNDAYNSNKTGSNLNLNTSGKSDDKTEEEEEDSPTFEPIDIMNLNESNISNDSHLSGISELTSHRSRSPDFCNELSRDNFDYSNQDSQLSKVSSDSRLSIVTDFGSNHASTPLHDPLKDDINKERCDKNVKDNFKVVNEFDLSKHKSAKHIFELSKSKDIIQDIKDSKSSKSSLSSKENSRDGTDGIKEKYDHKHNKDKSKENESFKSKSKDKNYMKDFKYQKNKSSEKKKERSHSSSGKYDKYDKNKGRDKNDQASDKLRDNEKLKDSESPKEATIKFKDDKSKEQDKKESTDKEVKDLKDLYKEKIRELREKKELTEKEKLSRDNKEAKLNKECKEKKESPKDKKPYKKDHKSSSSRTSSTSGYDGKRARTPDKNTDGKDRRNESRDKSKRDDKRSSKDVKSRNSTMKLDIVEKADKQDIKKIKTEEKNEKSELKKDTKLNSDKTNGRKDIKNHHTQSKSSSRNDKLDGKKDNRTDLQNKDKKRKDEKKSKPKDDHSSLRKDTNDRRSSDRDGSNGSSSKSSHSSITNSSSSNNKSSSSNLLKETGSVSNSSGETSDSVEEANANEVKIVSNTTDNKNVELASDSNFFATNSTIKIDHSKMLDSELLETNLPLKKRPLLNENGPSPTGEIKVKKPKFAKNIHEAKKLMKIRKQMEKQQLKESRKFEKKPQQPAEPPVQLNTINKPDNFERVPDEERVQIIEVTDEEYEEPYPEQQTNLTLEASSLMLFESKVHSRDLFETHSNLQLKLSDMELCIGQSLSEKSGCLKEDVKDTITDLPQPDTQTSVVEPPKQEQLSTPTDQVDVQAQLSLNETGNLLPKQSDDPPTEEKNALEEKGNALPAKSDTTNNTDDEYKVSINSDTTNNIKLEKTIPSNEDEPVMPDTLKITENTLEDNKTNTNIPLVGEVSGTSQSGGTSSGYASMCTGEDEDCRYFRVDNEKSEKFANFLESFHLMGTNSLEDIIQCLGGQVVTSIPKAMAPPLPKRKHSSSPLSDILLSNSDNNNEAHKRILSSPSDDSMSSIKKRKVLVPKKQQRPHVNICTPQGLVNGENFVMPLSPESDVSATSEKIPSANLIKEEKGRHRSSQRYSSDDLYKPRPLFSSSSRRSRRSNQA